VFLVTSAIAQLGEIFTADKPVEDPRALFGRSAELREVLIAYESSSSGIPVLTGPPGIGKSSLLVMLRQILVGSPLVLDRHGLGTYQPASKRRLVIIQRCDSSMLDEDALSLAILRNVDRAILERPEHERFVLRGFELSASVKFATVKGSWERSAATCPLTESPTLRLATRLEALTLSDINEISILLDECEQLTWLERLMDYTRNFHQGEVRFCIATREHAAHKIANSSSGDYRWPKRVPIGPLPAVQIKLLFDDAAAKLRTLGVRWVISPEAMNYIEVHSGGEPWYIQMIGDALLFDPTLDLPTRVATLAEQLTMATITTGRNEVMQAEQRMLVRRLLGLHAERYQQLVQRAPKREELLRALAKFPGSVIPKEYVNTIRRSRIAVARKVVDDLTQSLDPVLVVIQPGLLWQFAEHQFRVYCRLVKEYNSGVDYFVNLHVENWRTTS
jgi:energy-coupling factor transporter ATP-binding protein EcfA2